ncbi:MAG: type II toxin-antitoxin system RelE/ParE family toxin [Treponema sp.]|nr:type II toxin-antitoxin system RelE/ParE family toxin [Treponema sp.]
MYYRYDKTFGNSETEKIWNGKKSPKLPPEIHKRAFAKLLIIHSAESEEDLKIPQGNKFEHLSGNLKDYCSIRINDQWRIQFKFQNNEAYEVQIVDYH